MLVSHSLQAKRRRESSEQASAPSVLSGSDSHNAPADLSKDSFLDILRRGSAGSAKPSAMASERGGAAAPGASFMRDDFMLGRHKAKDWGTDEAADEVDFVEDARGADLDDESD